MNPLLGVTTPFSIADVNTVINAVHHNNFANLNDPQNQIYAWMADKRLLCPHPNNVALVTCTFQNFICPWGFRVLNVWGIQCPQKPRCRWEVWYTTEDPNDAVNNDPKLVEERLEEYPTNAQIVRKSFQVHKQPDGTYAYRLEYFLSKSKCLCQDFTRLTTSSLDEIIIDREIDILLSMVPKVGGRLRKIYLHCEYLVPGFLSNHNTDKLAKEDNTAWTLLDMTRSYITMWIGNKIGVLFFLPCANKLKEDSISLKIEDKRSVIIDGVFEAEKFTFHAILDHLGMNTNHSFEMKFVTGAILLCVVPIDNIISTRVIHRIHHI